MSPQHFNPWSALMNRTRRCQLQNLKMRNLGFISRDGCRARLSGACLFIRPTSVCVSRSRSVDILFSITIIRDWVHLVCIISHPQTMIRFATPVTRRMFYHAGLACTTRSLFLRIYVRCVVASNVLFLGKRSREHLGTIHIDPRKT